MQHAEGSLLTTSDPVDRNDHSSAQNSQTFGRSGKVYGRFLTFVYLNSP